MRTVRGIATDDVRRQTDERVLANATLPMTYGGAKSGSHWWELTVNPMIVARPDTSVGLDDLLRQYGQIGTGGCTSRPQFAASLNAEHPVFAGGPEPSRFRRELRERSHRSPRY